MVVSLLLLKLFYSNVIFFSCVSHFSFIDLLFDYYSFRF